ncbi:hypothetical protein [Pseudorhodoferax sp. Leaf274]|uniref:hypothetical protein n=1 Tax=Pseudorhodoferax sp. Leaf274 TaxID=1736318 RepID=UPI000702FCE0|nr:hypothetical protein [Pseudorhodoferax sp. Leaf274]KQP35414.1 hypothetical protein ASF44_18900 [Pseudorhodoferax sp. Leaf274]
MQHDRLDTAEPIQQMESPTCAAKRMAAGLHAELGLAANGKALRHDRLGPWDTDRAARRDARPMW